MTNRRLALWNERGTLAETLPKLRRGATNVRHGQSSKWQIVVHCLTNPAPLLQDRFQCGQAGVNHKNIMSIGIEAWVFVPYHTDFVRTRSSYDTGAADRLHNIRRLNGHVCTKTTIRVTFRNLPAICSLTSTSTHVLMKTAIRVTSFF